MKEKKSNSRDLGNTEKKKITGINEKYENEHLKVKGWCYEKGNYWNREINSGLNRCEIPTGTNDCCLSSGKNWDFKC